jgi:hypothetical protein
MKMRTLLELDEVYQNIQPQHFFVLRVFGIPVFRFNRLERRVEINDDDDGQG